MRNSIIGPGSLLLALVFLVACGPSGQPPAPPPPTSSRDANIVVSSDAEDYLGKSATVEVKRGYCEYRRDVNGRPTFCNDAKFPSHTFTMVVWGSARDSWDPPPESWDGKCFRVKGMISSYRGNPQIEAKDSSQVSGC